jgi:putative membrane protein insertion efficiency factor
MKMIGTLMAGSIRAVSSLAAYCCIALVWGYRLLLAPLFPASCRYNPSCSAYAIEAIKRFGPIKGSLLAGRRLLACHPWGDHGHDPVPESVNYRDLLRLQRGRP